MVEYWHFVILDTPTRVISGVKRNMGLANISRHL